MEIKIKKRYQVNLPEQQAECEANYYRLQRLLGELPALPLHHKRQYIAGNGPNNDQVVTFRITEQTKYTTLVHIDQTPVLQNEIPYDKRCSINKQMIDHSGTQNTIDNTYCHQPATDVSHCYETAYEAVMRVYHDVGLAEVISCQHHRQFNPRYEYPNDQMHQVDEKAQVNRFLSELLAHCLIHGRVNHSVISLKLTNKKYA